MVRADQFKGITSRHYQALFRISQLINSAVPAGQLFERIMDIVLEVLDARRGFLVFFDEDSRRFEVKVAREIDKGSLDDMLQLSNSVLWQVIQSGKPLLMVDAQSDPRFAGSQSLMMANVRSVLAVPLTIKEKLWGVIYVDSDQQREQFNRDSLEFMQFFAQQTALAIENARLYEQLRRENRQLRVQVEQAVAGEFIGQHPSIKQILEMAVKVAPSDAPILIEGESGTGKEVLARVIHRLSNRKDKPFLVHYCGALADSLMESELFGHKKGAFTGALSDKVGLLEMAHRGTFLLDEVGDLRPDIQANLLRVIQNGEIKRVGETRLRRIDVRFLSATHRNLRQEVQEGRFREDLYFRLNVVNIRIPPLRERPTDIPLLAEHFLRKHLPVSGKTIAGFNKKAVQKLMHHNWPGNVRELENVIRRAVLLCEGSEISENEVLFETTAISRYPAGTLQEMEREIVLKTLQELGGNRTHTARRLGVSVRWLQYKLKEWGKG